jgi:hypothetical protein
MSNKDKLRIVWSKREKDFMIHYPHPCDGSLISQLLKPWNFVHPSSLAKDWPKEQYRIVDCYEGSLGGYSLIEEDWLAELDRRGYDLTTLKFEISRKKDK